MKTVVIALAAALAVLPARALDVGAPAPAIQLPGTPAAVDTVALKGQVLYVDFWASWCAPCKRSFPWLNEMQAKYGARGLRVIGVNVDRKRSEAEAFLAQVPAQFQVGYDAEGETPRRYAVRGMPTSLLVGADGRVILRHEGFKDDDRAALEAAIAAALKR